jgi:hypothetical protein
MSARKSDRVLVSQWRVRKTMCGEESAADARKAGTKAAVPINARNTLRQERRSQKSRPMHRRFSIAITLHPPAPNCNTES